MWLFPGQRDETVQTKQTHGHARDGKVSGTYRTWTGMKERTTNKHHVSYRYYGGRGIKVCARWLVFANFLADMGERPVGESLDRINPAKDYEPGNCRWATRREQAFNRRPRQTAEVKPMNDAAKGLDLNSDSDYSLYIGRLNAPGAQDRPLKHSPGQYKTPIRKSFDDTEMN